MAQDGTVLYHGTDIESARDILTNGFSMAAAHNHAGTGDALWTTQNQADALLFALTNPRGNAPAILKLTLPPSLIATLLQKSYLFCDGPVYRFAPAAVDGLNTHAHIQLVA